MKLYQEIYKDSDRIGLDFNSEAEVVVFKTEEEAWKNLACNLGYDPNIAPLLKEVSQGIYSVKEIELEDE